MAQTRSANMSRANATRTNTYRSNTSGSNSGRTTNARNTGRREADAYIYGNTARQLNPQRQWENEPRKQLSHETRKNRDKARHMSFGYVAFLTAAFVVCGCIIINYIQLQSEVTNRTKGLARLESELNRMKQTNDEERNRIDNSVDMEEVKRIAFGELGMTYAEEGQIVTYSSVENDYMRQVSENAK